MMEGCLETMEVVWKRERLGFCGGRSEGVVDTHHFSLNDNYGRKSSNPSS